MKEPQPLVDLSGEPGTVFQFPRQQILTRRQAADYLGISEKRLQILFFLREGPASVRQGGISHYRKDDLDTYAATLFADAGLSDDELTRHRTQRAANGFVGIDRFMDMASRDDVSRAYAFYGGRIAIVVGMIVIVLSHTPLSRLLFHMQ
ncbi:hypothetical protein AA0313_1641 [Acetobacter indonesiensis NRIC 0313]|uniref:Helix-turn-helix domain-containing protein n=1 Tax=Acetobacter indonesiensis TaxID=104101 RepID=A0A252ATC7_9PROT|nr:hypothetical protein [Acetobacter indonesiensis]OUI93465.1 hypothetical protein HK17_08010 [Acetobacter indonesiensis]GAN61809.1 hypothetical protein Abin_002_065 [Acetobacter indonesiensis]GBQ57968.1 hypothetical protein AA0313_1641 [Acetobacter indonesiensis NRIC 0313]GEN03647.1 hypothetical protein AIN02nite_16720 [Acetobacter indonesiensis]